MRVQMLTSSVCCRYCVRASPSDVKLNEGHELRGGPLPGQLNPRAVPHHRRHYAGGHREVSFSKKLRAFRVSLELQ